MSLIRLIFSAVLSACLVSFSGMSNAEVLLAMNTPEPALVNDVSEPEFLTSARNVRIELLPPEPAAAVEPLTVPNESAAAAKPEIAQGDLWERIRGSFAMNDLNSRLVTYQENWYAKHPDYVDRMMERARRYLFYITEEVERRGMPSEIALLPMVESAFNPGAYSVASASGIWQFIPSTGKKFGMQQNWWYDGRRDVVNATNGALDYLQKLHDMFGDWELALAAYNCGEGAVARAQAYNRKHGRPTNFASLKLLKETRNYVPKLIAIKNIISDPAKFSLSLPEIPDKPYFVALATPDHMDVKLAAELADISEEEFIALNPAHTRPVILQDSTDLILLPIEKMNTFLSNLENNDKPLVSWQPYQPKKGERLDQLAPRFGLSVENLKRVNGLSNRGNISNGQTLLVPVTGEEDDTEFAAFNMNLVDDHGRATRHRIRRGDTLSQIARKYHVSVSRLKQWNGPMRILRVGQTISVSPPGSRQYSGDLSNTAKVF